MQQRPRWSSTHQRRDWAQSAPYRAEPYSLERLEQHARELAATLAVVSSAPRDTSFFARFSENAEILREAYREIAAAVRQGAPLRPDAEWLLDNFYVVEEHLREIRDDLPRRFYHELPKIASGELRVYRLAIELISHTDSVLDEETIVRFVSEFQTVAPLSMGELWAVPIMLRLVLVENLRRIAEHMLAAKACREEASELVETWIETGAFPSPTCPLGECRALVLPIIERLQEDVAEHGERYRELERRLAAEELTAQQLVHLEHQHRAANQVSIGNVITSMRLITALDWVLFFERTSFVDQALRLDPAGVYARMDSESRDRYRHVVETLAKGSHVAETDVAKLAVRLAGEAPREASKARHVGYFLIDAGLPRTEAALPFRPPLRYRLKRFVLGWPNLVYLSAIGTLTLLAALLAAFAADKGGLGTTWLSTLWIVAFALLALLPGSELAIHLVNFFTTLCLTPRLIPKLDLGKSIPPDCRTAVVIPSMLTGRGEIESLLERLEIHYLANPDPRLSFALLTDFADAPDAEMPRDQELVEQARAGIRELNAKYANGSDGPFYLFHRERRWNEQGRAWMGWERKRGKLSEFNRWLRGAQDTSYVVQEGALEQLRGTSAESRIRYVLTLDSDTQLPHGAAKRLIGALAHPLNQPSYDAERRRFTSGYVLLQPRVTVHLASAHTTRFAKLFANNPGLDPYATCNSDVYQDLFGEGSFTGKGLYDLDAFETALHGTFPENRILSHDLIEGCHTRVGLVTDIEVFDNYPAKYESEARRQHRWVRGDWQILPWLLPRVPGGSGWRRNPLSLLSRWKIFDNLRRSLVPPTLLALLIVGWLRLPDLAGWFTLAGLLVLGFPLVAQFALALRGWPRDVSFGEHLRVLGNDLTRSAAQTVFLIAVLPHKAASMLDAIARTLVRLTLTRRRLLEWETASDVERRLAKGRASALAMWCVPVLAVVVGALLMPWTWIAALPFLIPWLAAPLLVYWSAQPLAVRGSATLGEEDRRYLRLSARRAWAFFEAYVGAEDHWLPPDNVQEYPAEKVAHRISPTNEGLYLVSAMVARDFGYLSLHALTDLWERNQAEWQKLDRLHGHFYNWYETTTLKPLFPRYVSTVDSGNLAVCYLTLKQGIEELRRKPILGAFLREGLTDTIHLVLESGERRGLADDPLVEPLLQRTQSLLASLADSEQSAGDDPTTWPASRERWQAAEKEVANLLESYQRVLDQTKRHFLQELQLLLSWLRGARAEADTLFPWMALPPPSPPLKASDAVGSTWDALREQLASARTLDDVRQLHPQTAAALAALRGSLSDAGAEKATAMAWLERFEAALRDASSAAAKLDERLLRLAARYEELALGMDFHFLFNQQRRLFSIGFNLEEGNLDGSHYDLLCSEARLASYLAIAKGDVEAQHWFKLGRQLTQTAGQVTLLSWGGTMFEYLMPPLFQKIFESSLLWQSCRAAVARQQEYGRQRGVPWGISECAFAALAVNSDYHYRSFGTPGLGLKRGLSNDLVVSPYSTMLAVEVDTPGALANLHALERHGGLGQWGFYEAIDYTPERLPVGKESVVVRCYMAHHQGMSLVALGNLLTGGGIRRRFHEHPLARATELLLQEKIPAQMPKLQPHPDEGMVLPAASSAEELVGRRIVGVDTDTPRTHLLSNGEYAVMLTSTGGGYSHCGDLAISRWRSDATRDHWGQFLYLRDPASGNVWSATYQPTRAEPDSYEVTYLIDKADFRRRDGELESHLEVVVSPENNAEVRQLKITNHGDEPRRVEITSYLEIALNAQQADLSHPAFHKLFVETEYIGEETALLAKRRPRDSQQPPVWAVHVISTLGDAASTVQFETSRQAFIGRNRDTEHPAALEFGTPLTGTVGAVLDPVFALRCIVKIPPHESAWVGFATAFAKSREEAMALADQYHDPRGIHRAFELAWAYVQVELRHLNISAAKMHLYQRLSSALLYPNPARRGPLESLLANRQGQSGLWRHGISGDFPLMLVHVTKPEQIELVRELMIASAYLRGRGLKCDLAVLNDYPGSYLDALQEQLVGLLNERNVGAEDKPRGIFLLRGAQLAAEDKLLLDAAASVVLHGERGSLTKQLERPAATPVVPTHKAAASSAKPDVVSPPLAPQRVSPQLPAAKTAVASSVLLPTNGDAAGPAAPQSSPLSTEELEFWNGWGGFAHDGREYHIRLKAGSSRAGSSTPMPWSNVIANERFGCLVTEAGGGYTWFTNSRENKLTTWSNDPISDAPSEAIYLRDEESGDIFSPWAGVVRDEADYWAQHGQGYSRFLHESQGIGQEALVSIAPEDPVKFVVVTLRNRSGRRRRISAAYFAEWVLGVCREETQLHVVTSVDEASGALLATNGYHPELRAQVAFLHVLASERSLTADRREFIGRNGDVSHPAALDAGDLSSRTGAGLDPCGAVQTVLTLAPGQEQQVVFVLGAGSDLAETQKLLAEYAHPKQVTEACEQTAEQWEETLTTIQVTTPNRALDLLVNRWLLYQTLSCRFWGRSAYYQAGGAYGFRDQLQDSLALVYSRPDLTREHLLRAASRQFEEGDVQHWWHVPAGRGTRTRFSDDLLWLPFATCHYLAVTGDDSVLTEKAPFLHSPLLDAREQERYELPAVSPQQATLYEHCLRAIRHAFRLGPHGLPLMGCGDWNDGMNKVGEHGQGESVWVGWFLLVLLDRFIPVMEAQGDTAAAGQWQARAAALRESLEQHAWDGRWYRRAYFDNGAPLGSAENEECQIDSIAQTWAVLAGAKPERTRSAIDAVLERLVDWDDQLVRLFTPPFNKSPLDPGYIKGYLPGVRENGGQYTHPALWLIEALTEMGDGDTAMRIFDLINPIHHAATPADAARYQVEPYVAAADIYGVPPHVGRGGWTWYTGSAAWMYRAALEFILGFRLKGEQLTFHPTVPSSWQEFEVRFRRASRRCVFRVRPHDREQSSGPDDREITQTLSGRLTTS